MPRPHGYYWVKFAADPQPQVVLIQEDGAVWVFGETQAQYISGEEPEFAKGTGIIIRDHFRPACCARDSNIREPHNKSARSERNTPILLA